MEIPELRVESCSLLPKEKWVGPNEVYKINGFWFMGPFHEGTLTVINHFNPFPTDIIMASFPKTGTTWLKSLLHCIVNGSSKHSLTQTHPHELVPTLEVYIYQSKVPISGIKPTVGDRRIVHTHIPYQLLSRALDFSDSKVVYITRNPKDTLISMWHFTNKFRKPGQEVWQLEDAIEKFCAGVFPCGPYYDHVLGYWKESMKKPEKVMFITYEDLQNDPRDHVKRLAEFFGCPFDGEEGEVEEVVRSCSFGILSNHEVNKSDDSMACFPLPYNAFFRKGENGDYKNYLDDATIERIDAITREKFHRSGFMYGI